MILFLLEKNNNNIVQGSFAHLSIVNHRTLTQKYSQHFRVNFQGDNIPPYGEHTIFFIHPYTEVYSTVL